MIKTLSPSRLATYAVILAAVLFVAVNVIANLWLNGLRLDVTENQIYSTSDAAAPIFENVKEPIVVRVYFSERIGEVSPQHEIYYQRVRDILEQYAELSGGMLKLEFYDPEPFSDVEDRAVGFGLQSVPLDDLGEPGYFGLAATNSTDDQEVIPFFNLEREQFLEYDLAKLIYNLSNPVQPKVGLISSLPIDGGPAQQRPGMGRGRGGQTQPWVIMRQIREFFEVETLEPTLTAVPPDINMLMLVQPQGLSPAAQYAIDQFVLGGGKVLAFVDPNAEAGGPMGRMSAGREDIGAMLSLLDAWGVRMPQDVVIGDLDSAMRVNMGGAVGQASITDYVAWLEIGEGNIDPADAVTGDLGQLNFGTAGALGPVEGATSEFTPLVLTSPRSMRIPADEFVGMPDVVSLFRDFESQDRPEVLAARLGGTVSSAFAGGPPDSAEGAGEHLAESRQPAQVIVVADTDFLTDRFWTDVRNFLGQQVAIPRADNAAFVVNALENLSGSPALSSLRGRSVRARPFELIERIRQNAERQYRATEQRLSARLEELEAQMQDIQLRQDGEGTAIMSEEDRRLVENYRSQMLETRRELREVQRALREDIEALEGAITFVNIGGIPIVFGLILIGLAGARHRRRARRMEG